MISRLVILLLLPVLLTMGYLASGEEHIVGIIILAALCIGFFCTVVMKTPVWGALFLVISLHWFQIEDIYYSLYMLFIAAFVYAMYMFHRGDFKPDRAWYVAAMSQLAFVAIVYALKPYPVKMMFFYMNVTTFFFFLGSSLIRWDSSRVQNLLTAHLSYMVIWAFVERAISSEVRIGGASFSATNFAVLLVVSWTIWLVNGLLCNKTRRFWLIIMTLLVFLSILFSGTRMGFLGMGLGGVLCILSKQLVVQSDRRDRIMGMLPKLAMFTGVFAVLVFVVWNLLPDDLFLKKGFQTLLSGKLDASSLGRIAAWYTAVTVIPTHPLWGVGPGNFISYNVELLDSFSFIPIVEMIPRLGHAHNIVLMILADYGCIGAGALLVICLVCLKRLMAYIRRTGDGFGFALLSGGIVMMFLGLFDVFPLFPSSMGWGGWFMSVMFSLRQGKGPKE